MLVVRVVAWILSGLFLFGAYRWTRSRSRVLAIILALGIVGRAVIGFSAFAISLYRLPVFSSLQAGGGFWTLAIDAEWYFHAAAEAARLGIGTISDATASPMYLRAFAVWLQIAGVSPANAVLFNLLCYLGIAVTIVATCRHERVAAIALGAMTVDPAFLIFGTQALKDPFCILLIAIAVGGVRVWSEGIDETGSRRLRRLGIGQVLVTAAVFALAGVRAYAAVFVIIGVFASGVTAMLARGSARLWPIAAANSFMVVALLVAFAQGAGGYYPYYEGLARSVVTSLSPSPILTDLDHARAAFAAAGGATSIVGEPSETGVFDSPLQPKNPAKDARSRRLLRGCAAVFVPISLLRELSIVNFSGGRGLLVITDIDTVVLDATAVATMYLLGVAWSRRRASPSVICLTVIFVVTTTVLAYTVTNFGTLFRLRLMAVATLWLLPAFAYSDSGSRTSSNSPDSSLVGSHCVQAD